MVQQFVHMLVIMLSVYCMMGKFTKSYVIRHTITIQISTLTINKLLADLFIRQAFFCQALGESKFTKPSPCQTLPLNGIGISVKSHISTSVHLQILLNYPVHEYYHSCMLISFILLRWQSSNSPTQLIVFINIAETKPFTILNSRYLLTNTGSW